MGGQLTECFTKHGHGRMWYNKDGFSFSKYYFGPFSHKLKREAWRMKGVFHRENDQPAIITYHTDGTLRSEKWYNHGHLHRENDQPAWKEYAVSQYGTWKREEWYKDGTRYARENDEPSIIEWRNDRIVEKTWCKDVEFYRENNKPSLVYYKTDGTITEMWWKGNHFTTEPPSKDHKSV